MPVYCFKCPACGHTGEELRPVDRRNAPLPCFRCERAEMERDIQAEFTHSTDQEYQRPIYSDAAGIHPSQVPEYRRRFPHHEVLDDGRMVFRSHAQRNRVLKEIGMHDRDGYN